jgi:hypothetical protein
MNMTFTLLLFLLALLFCGKSVYAINNTYYIDNINGNNSNSGMTQGEPWKDFTKINDASFILGAGDSVLLKSGCVWDQELWLKGSGTSSSWCKLGSYGGDIKPRISRNSMANTICVKLVNPSYWKIENVEVDSAYIGIQIYYDTLFHEGLELKNIYAHHIQGIWGRKTIAYPNDLSNSNAPLDPWAVENNAVMSSGINITGSSNMVFTDLQYACKNIVVQDYEGAHNVDSITFNGTFTTTDDGYNLFQNIQLIRLNVHDGDGHSDPIYKAANLGTSDAVRLVNVWHLTMVDSRVDNVVSQYTSSGTAAIILGRCKDVKFFNNAITNVPSSNSSDQCAADHEFATDSVLFNSNYFAGNSGPALEYLTFRGATGGNSDHCTNHEISGNIFVDNALSTNGNEIGSGSLYTYGSYHSPTGSSHDNLFFEPNKPFSFAKGGGKWSSFWFYNNKRIDNARMLRNAITDFSMNQGENGWSYKYKDTTGSWVNLPYYDGSKCSWGINSGSIGQSVTAFELTTGEGANPDIARAFVVPALGNITVRGHILMPQANGATTKARITKNGIKIWPVSSSAYQTISDIVGVDSFLDDIAVMKGDLIQFEVINGSVGSNAIVGWTPTIAYTNTDFAIGKTASASSNLVSNMPSNVADGNKLTYWSSNETPLPNSCNENITIDLGTNVIKYNKVVLVPRYTNNQVYCFPVDFTIQVADSISGPYTTVRIVNDCVKPESGEGVDFFINTSSKRYLRINTTVSAIDSLSKYYVQLADIKVIYSAGEADFGTNLAIGRPVFASANYVWDPKRVVDNLLGTPWSSQMITTSNRECNEYLIVDMQNKKSFNQIVLYPRYDAGVKNFPVNFMIQGANDDNGPWVNMVVKTDFPAPTMAEGVAFYLGNRNFRYVRVYVTKAFLGTGTFSYVQLAEVKIYFNALSSFEASVASSKGGSDDTWQVSNLFDERASSSWSSTLKTSADNNSEWAYVDIGQASAFNQVILYPRNYNTLPSCFPATFKIQGSNTSNSGYVDLLSKVDYPNPVSGDSGLIFNVGTRNYRYIRFYGIKARASTTSPTSYYFQISGMEVLSERDYLRGDLNLDGAVNIKDIQIAINIITGTVQPTSQQLMNGDLDDDGAISEIDIEQIVDIINNSEVN